MRPAVAMFLVLFFALGYPSLLIIAIRCWNIRRYEEGKRDGYEQGYKAAEDWFIRAETEIAQAREEIWRQEQ